MSKLLATLLAAVFAAATVTPVIAADAKDGAKMEAKKEDGKAKGDAKKADDKGKGDAKKADDGKKDDGKKK
jgi:opacity protein-like surface antigen